MYYNSTRNNNVKIDSALAIKTGISADGGLFVPNNIPQVDMEFICSLTDKSYKQRAVEILGKFLTDYTTEELMDCAVNAYDDKKYGSSDTAPLKKLNDNTPIL